MRNILITGASRGIGRAIAEILADENSHFYLHGRDEKALLETEKIVTEKGATATLVLADLSDQNEVVKMSESIKCDKLDILIHSAGIAIAKPFEELTIDDWNKVYNVNVTAPFILTSKLNSKLKEGSSIVSIVSVASKQVFNNWSVYCMSKFALDGFMKTIREELRPRKVRVINIYPGAIDTDIWKDIPGEWDRDTMMKAKQVAEAVLYAVSQPEGTLIEDITLTNLR